MDLVLFFRFIFYFQILVFNGSRCEPEIRKKGIVVCCAVIVNLLVHPSAIQCDD